MPWYFAAASRHTASWTAAGKSCAMYAIFLMPRAFAWLLDQSGQKGVFGPSRLTNMFFAGGWYDELAAQPPTTGMPLPSRYFWLAASAIVAWPTMATTFSCSTSVRAAWAFLPGSPASSKRLRSTRYPLMPPWVLV